MGRTEEKIDFPECQSRQISQDRRLNFDDRAPLKSGGGNTFRAQVAVGGVIRFQREGLLIEKGWGWHKFLQHFQIRGTHSKKPPFQPSDLLIAQ
jgi:hypothetical protein